MKQIKKLIAKILLVTFFFQIFGGVNFSQASGNTRPADINVTSYNIPFDPNNPPTGEVAIGKIQAEPGVSYKIFLGKGIGGKDSEEVHYCQPITPEDISAKLNANNEIVIGSINNNRYYYYLAIIGTNGNGGSIVKSFNLGIGYYYNNNHSIRIFKNNDTSIAFGYRSLHNDCFMQAIDITGAEKIIEPNPNRNPEAYQDSYIKGSVGDDYTNRYYKYRKVIKQGEKINLADFTLKKAIDRPGYFDLSNIVNPQKSVDIVDPDGNILTDEQVKNYDFSTPGNYTFNYKSSFFDANNIGYGGFSTINQYQILVNPILKTTCTAGTPIKNGKFEIATLGDASNTYILAQDDIDAGYSIVGNKLYRNQKVDTEGTRNLSVEIRSPNYKVHSPTYYDENLVEGIVKNGENYENITGYKNGTGTPYTPLYEEYHKWLGCDWDGDGVTDATTWDDCSGAAAHAPYYEDVYDTSKVLYRLRTDITTLYPEKKVLLEGYTEGLSTENLKINEVCPTAPTVFTATKDFTATENVQRDNCAENFTGTSVDVSVTLSATATGATQTEADNLALAEAKKLAQTKLAEVKQSQANINGQCIQTTFEATKTVEKSQDFTRNNCDDGFAGGVVNVSKSATATATGTTQTEADNLALEKATQKAKKLLADEGQDEANTNGTCTQVIFDGTGTFTASGQVVKNDCPEKFTASGSVLYELPKTATATGSSQAEADKLALQKAQNLAETEFENTKQDYANEHGICKQVIFDGTGSFTKTGSFVRNNCETGKYGTAVEFSKTETATATGGSQDEANNLALAEATRLANLNFDTQGQAFANENGTCSDVERICKDTQATNFSDKIADGVKVVEDESVCEYKTTKWLDENNEELKSSETGKTFGDKGSFDGYEFVSEEVNGDEKIYKFKKIIKTTKWVDENSEELKGSETGTGFGEVGSFDGYTFKEVNTSADGKIKTYIFKQIEKVTKWLDENNEELKSSETGKNKMAGGK
ncbi:hypothetical protein KGV55_00285 [Candidatus Gracilibacteria bacterium]|nr:hypothetical protein [Candidatus Gracilibacteria bacterium]